MCIGREIGLHVVICLKCRKPYILCMLGEEKFDGRFCHCDGPDMKVRYEGNGVWSEWFRPDTNPITGAPSLASIKK